MTETIDIEHVVIYGPQACGKTRNKDHLARKFECEEVVDGMPDGAIRRMLKLPRQRRTLFLTIEKPRRIEKRIAKVISFDAAMAC